MDNPLLKYNAKEYFFKASLCHFIVDELNAKVRDTHRFTDALLQFERGEDRTRGLNWTLTYYFVRVCVFQLAIEKYEEMFPAFSDSRELKLLKVNLFNFWMCMNVWK